MFYIRTKPDDTTIIEAVDYDRYFYHACAIITGIHANVQIDLVSMFNSRVVVGMDREMKSMDIPAKIWDNALPVVIKTDSFEELVSEICTRNDALSGDNVLVVVHMSLNAQKKYQAMYTLFNLMGLRDHTVFAPVLLARRLRKIEHLNL